MINYYIFGFGLVVTLLVGTGLVTLLLAHNRSLQNEEDPPATETPEPAPSGARHDSNRA